MIRDASVALLDFGLRNPKQAGRSYTIPGSLKLRPSPACVTIGTSLFVAALETPEQDHLVKHGKQTLYRPKELASRWVSEWPEDCSGPS